MAEGKTKQGKPALPDKAKSSKTAPAENARPSTAEAGPPAQPAARTVLGVVREWSDALVIAFLLAMFIRTFVVELFKIPSGSMTPTLVGTSADALGRADEYALEWDVDGNGVDDLVLKRLGRGPRYHVFYRNERHEFVGNEETHDLHEPLEVRRKARARNDRIVVNKFLYWFRPPRRGDIVVFRVPPCIYEPEKPIYIKRVVGRPGEVVEIREPHLYVNGRRVTEPEVFERIQYVNYFGTGNGEPYRPDYIEWHLQKYPRPGWYGSGPWEWFDRATVPAGHYLVFGDNSKSSKDSRDWGAVPEANLKGTAILRYWPWDTFGRLR